MITRVCQRKIGVAKHIFNVILISNETKKQLATRRNTMIEQMITEKKFAELCNLTLAGLRTKRNRGEDITHYKVGRKTLYNVEDVNAFFESKKVTAKK